MFAAMYAEITYLAHMLVCISSIGYDMIRRHNCGRFVCI